MLSTIRTLYVIRTGLDRSGLGTVTNTPDKES